MTFLLAAALILDQLLGEPSRFHPLRAFGRYAIYLEKTFFPQSKRYQLIAGLFCWCLAVFPLVLFVAVVIYLCAHYLSTTVYWVINGAILYLTIGQKSLMLHACAVYNPLLNVSNNVGSLSKARVALSMIVSRDTKRSSPNQIATATIETVTENTHDAIIGPMVFFILLGAPGAVLFRLSNTLDAMWGYRSETYERFGKCSARIDDVLGFIPARITACLMVLSFPLHAVSALKSIWLTGRKWYSPNAGIVMAAGAGALSIKLGGDAIYQGVKKTRLTLGLGRTATAGDIKRSIVLMYLTSALFVLLIGWLEYLLPDSEIFSAGWAVLGLDVFGERKS